MGQGYVTTKQEIMEYIAEETRRCDLVHFEPLVTASVCDALKVSRNLASQYLNEGFKDGLLIKISTRPVYFLDKKTVLSGYGLEQIEEEFGDLAEFTAYIQSHRKIRKNFEKAIGCNLSLKPAADSCRMAVDYPPYGLSLHIEGVPGSGKSLFAQLSYLYAKDMKLVPENARFHKIDCAAYRVKEWDSERIRRDIAKRLSDAAEGDFLFLRSFDELSDEVQMWLLHQIEGDDLQGRETKVRWILSTTGQMGKCLQYLRKVISVHTILPELDSRPAIEKELLILHFLQREEKRLGRRILISEQSYQILVQHHFSGNVGELEHCIKEVCAKAFSIQKEQEMLSITFLMLPKELIRGVKLAFQRQVGEERLLSLKEIRRSSDFYREERLCSQILERMERYLKSQCGYPEFLEEAAELLDDYNEYILFRRSVENDKIRIVEQMMMKIFEYIRDVYSVDIPNSFIHVFSRWTYYGELFHEEMCDWQKEHEGQMSRLCEILQKESRNETLIAKEILELVRQNLEVSLSEIELVMLTVLLSSIKSAHEALPIQAFILCHGYATASSIADVCNKLMKKRVFHAMDMPYDMSVTEIGKRLRSILYYNENRDVLLLVDLGSLENIEEVIGEVPNVNFGIINNVSTNLALEIGFSILARRNIGEILAQAAANVKTSYRLMERSSKEDVLLFVSESGSDVAARVSELFLDSIPKTLELVIRCYDYEAFTELYRNGELEKYNVLFAATTVPIFHEDFPIIPIEDIITFNGFARLRECFNGYLSSEEFEVFRRNLLNSFSLQNVVEALTILNAGKVLAQVDSMLTRLQRLMKKKFSEKTIVGLNIHISCLIERLVKKEEITTHLNLEGFIQEQEEFIEMVQDSFSEIARQYNIQLVMSEIAYIYDYIQFDGKREPVRDAGDEF